MSDLTVRGLAEVLLDIGGGEKTGVLRIGVGGRLRMAFFEQGALVYLVSDVPEENLAAAFTRAGRLESAAERLTIFQLEREVTRKKTLVSLVLDRRLRDPETLRTWLAEHALEAFGRIFDARDVTAKFTPNIRAEHPLPFRVPATEVILDAVRRMRDDEIIHEAIGPVAWHTQIAEGATTRLQTLPLSFHEGLVASRVTGPMSIDDVVVVSGIAEMDALRAVLGLLLIGVLAPPREVKVLTDSARLRMRQTAVETGFVVDAETAAAALGISAAIASDDEVGDGAVTMGEFSGERAFAPRQRGHSAPLQYPPPRPRGDTSRLRLLASAYIQMGEAEAASGNFAAAVQCFESALAQRPTDLDTMLAYARVLAKRPGGMPAAERMLEQAAEAHPKKAAPLIQLARLYHEAGREEEAEETLLDARRIEPINAEIRTLLESLKKGGGLLSRLGIRSDHSKSRQAPSGLPRPAAPTANRDRLPPPPMGGAAEGPRLRCRYCGQMVVGEARICRSCGATL